MCLLTDLHIDVYQSPILHQQDSSNHNRSLMFQNSIISGSHSILMNICGRVLLFEMDIDTSELPFSSSSDDEDNCDSRSQISFQSKKPVNRNVDENGLSVIKFKKVVKLASNVENLWVLPHDTDQLKGFRSSKLDRKQNQMRPHLETSLYLACGGHGMAIWLSLEHSIRPQFLRKDDIASNESKEEHTYISKRIMLPLVEMASAIYPLAIRFREAIVLGAESDFNKLNLSFSSKYRDHLLSRIPFFVAKRTSQVYLHYILRELLRKNLGYRAWEIANTCSTLPHFVHALELLLHGVLEEEAGSSQPLPDALLPRVVEFIRAFPVFLQTVIHCTRKTELALWPHLFSIVGSPKDLFHQCLAECQLEAASSYIIVLQNLEKPEVAAKCAQKLLQAARLAGCWVTVKELKRFLRATNQAEENENFREKRSSLSDRQEETQDCNSSASHSPNPPSTITNHRQSLQFSDESQEKNFIANKQKSNAPEYAIKSKESKNSIDCHAENVIANEINGNNKFDCNENQIDCEEGRGKICNGHLPSNRYKSDNLAPTVIRSSNQCNGYLNVSPNGTDKIQRGAYPGTILRMTQSDNNEIHNEFPSVIDDSLESNQISLSESPSSSEFFEQSKKYYRNHLQNGPNKCSAWNPDDQIHQHQLSHPKTITLQNDREQCIIF